MVSAQCFGDPFHVIAEPGPDDGFAVHLVQAVLQFAQPVVLYLEEVAFARHCVSGQDLLHAEQLRQDVRRRHELVVIEMSERILFELHVDPRLVIGQGDIASQVNFRWQIEALFFQYPRGELPNEFRQRIQVPVANDLVKGMTAHRAFFHNRVAVLELVVVVATVAE